MFGPLIWNVLVVYRLYPRRGKKGGTDAHRMLGTTGERSESERGESSASMEEFHISTSVYTVEFHCSIWLIQPELNDHRNASIEIQWLWSTALTIERRWIKALCCSMWVITTIESYTLERFKRDLHTRRSTFEARIVSLRHKFYWTCVMHSTLLKSVSRNWIQWNQSGWTPKLNLANPRKTTLGRGKNCFFRKKVNVSRVKAYWWRLSGLIDKA